MLTSLLKNLGAASATTFRRNAPTLQRNFSHTAMTYTRFIGASPLLPAHTHVHAPAPATVHMPGAISNVRSYSQKCLVQRPAPAFEARACVDGALTTIQSKDYLGKYWVLFFYPLNFTFVCPTEITAFHDRLADFEALGCSVVAASVDSEFSHMAWSQQSRRAGGLGPVGFPLLSDMTKSISQDYGVLCDKGFALRGLFIMDKESVIRHMSINDAPIGRSVDEVIRLVQAVQFADTHGEVCPANWKPGQDAIKTTDAKAYFEKNN